MRYLRVKKGNVLDVIIKFAFVFYVFTLYVFVSRVDTLYISKYAFVVLFSLISVAILKENIPIRIGLYAWSFAMFIFFSLLSCTWALSIDIAFRTCLTLLQLFVMVILLYSYYANKDNDKFYIWALTIAGIAMSIYAITYYGIDVYINTILNKGRLGNDIANANNLGMNAALSVMGCVLFGLYYKKYIYFILSVLPTIVVLGTGSRTAFVMMVGGIGSLVVYKAVNPKKIFFSIIKIVFIVIIIYLVLNQLFELPIFNSIMNRFETMFNYFTGNGRIDSSTLERMQMISMGKEIFYSNPLWGIGIDNARIIAQSNGFWNTYLHNNFYELLANVGLIGFSLYYMIYIYIEKKLVFKLKTKDPIVGYVFFVILLKLAMDYGSVTYYSQITYVYFVLGFLVATRNTKQGQKEYNYDSQIN